MFNVFFFHKKSIFIAASKNLDTSSENNFTLGD